MYLNRDVHVFFDYFTFSGINFNFTLNLDEKVLYSVKPQQNQSEKLKSI